MAEDLDDVTKVEVEIQDGLTDEQAAEGEEDQAPEGEGGEAEEGGEATGDGAEGEEAGEDEGEAEVEPEDTEEPKQEPRSQKRIRELNAQKKAEKDRADQLEKEKAELQAKLNAQARERLLAGTPPIQKGQAVQQEQLVAPKPEDFANEADYWRAYMKYEAKVEARNTIAETEAQRQASNAKAEAVATLNKHKARVEAAAAKNPDLLENDPKFMVKLLNPPEKGGYGQTKLALKIAGHEKSAQLVQYLIANASETEKLLTMDTDSQLLALGEIAGRLASVKPKTVTQAAKPVKPVGAGESPPKVSGEYKPGDGPAAFTAMYEKRYGVKPGSNIR